MCVCVCVCVCDQRLAVLTKTVITCKIEYSQTIKLRSVCTPKHHDCAQVPLQSNKIASISSVVVEPLLLLGTQHLMVKDVTQS